MKMLFFLIISEGINITIAGFGATGEKSPGKESFDPPSWLLFTTELVLSDNYCETQITSYDARTDFCAKSPNTGICRVN